MGRVIEFTGYMKVPAKKNSMEFNTQTRKMYKSEEIRIFENYLMGLADIKKMEWEDSFGKWPMDKKYYLKLEVTYGDGRRRDVQNAFGSVCDALNGILYEDDCQIHRIAAQKFYEKDTWTFTIRLEEE